MSRVVRIFLDLAIGLPLPVVLGPGLAGCGESAPPAPVITLAPAGDTIASPYGELAGAAWLGGDRWAVAAPSDSTVAVADFGPRRIGPLGGPLGGGKGRPVRNPSTLFVVADTLYVGDWGLRRTTLWTLEGRLVRAIPTASAVRGVLPEARDVRGRFYLDLPPPPGPDGSGNRDSSALVRVAAGFAQVDTIGHLAPLDIAEVATEAGRRFERRVFSGTDQWGVVPDGSLWVARVYENRVYWRPPGGGWTRGEALPDRVLEVTRYDRELFVRKFPPELRTTAEQLPFAAVKPPFEAGLTSSTGEVWLEKSRAPADSSRRYHVVDRAGRLAREIRVPGPGRILAVGRDAALVAEPARGGTRLLRFALPAQPAAAAAAAAAR